MVPALDLQTSPSTYHAIITPSYTLLDSEGFVSDAPRPVVFVDTGPPQRPPEQHCSQ